MKSLTKLFGIVLFATVSAVSVSCGKDKKDEPKLEEPEQESNGEFYVKTGALTTRQSLNNLFIYHNEVRGGYDLVFVEDPNLQITPHMSVAPDCRWFALDIPEEIIGKQITETKDLDGADWDFYMANTYYRPTSRTWSYEIKSVKMTTSINYTEKTFSIDLQVYTTETPASIIELKYTGSYTDKTQYIWDWY